ncbi:MAG: hypothetical protein PUE05_00290, partial [bacterium]|nr:hypothetical protein [bacterium]
IHPDTHVAWMLRHDDAIVFIQIKHSVFGCKVHNQKRHLKVGLFRMVTPQLPLSGGGYRRDRCYGGVAGFCKIKAPAMPVGLRVLYGRWIRKGAESEVASII